MRTITIMPLIFLNYFFCALVFGYIDAAIEMKLVGNRRVILIFDAYEGYSLELNRLNAATIALAIKNLALLHPHEQIDFTYEDPAVYDMGNLLKANFSLIVPHVIRPSDDNFLSLIPGPSSPGKYGVLAIKKPDKLTTYLAGDLTLALASIPDWPRNLSIRSNDPRREHYLALVKSQRWLLDYQKNIRMKNLISASPLLAAKKMIFKMDQNLTEQQQQKIQTLLADFEKIEQQQLDGFANFASMRAKKDISVDDLNQSLYQLKDTISLEIVDAFLMQTKQRTDIYSDGPIVDVLLTMFNEHHPDTMVIILGNHLAKRLTEQLKELNVIESGKHIEDALGTFTKLAIKRVKSS